jgi:8-oxo-dGTP pyrophosphatase MutT (NUDIX family)
MPSPHSYREPMREGADALIRDPDGRVLLVRRADDRRWAMPGGWVDPGETPAQAAVREAFEETGLVVADPQLRHIATTPRSRHYTFECRVAGGELALSDESVDVGYLFPDEVVEWHRDHGDRVRAALIAATTA